jgi:putative two-component system response regulator
MLALAAAAEGKDPTTGGHLRRLAQLAALLGQELGLSGHQLQILRCGTLLHDIGKLAVRTAILCKPGPLTQDEWEEMRQHPLVGERICGCLRWSQQVGPIIRHHHEHWDGSGYPDGLGGPEIPYLARIASVVDAFDAMSSDRPYRKALAPRDVIRRMSAGAGKQWDPEIVQVFLELIEREGLDPGITPAERRAQAA